MSEPLRIYGNLSLLEMAPVLLAADRLSVGARLLPLLRKRLEVTSLVLDGPELTVFRDAGGRWWPAQRTLRRAPGSPAAGH